MTIDRDKFFDNLRERLFNKKPMDQDQVDGFSVMLDKYEELEWTSTPLLAYVMATAWHETAHTMQPIKEYGKGRGHNYGKVDNDTGQAYYGRGYVQLTWKYNYKKAGDNLGTDLVNNPDRALQPKIASEILFTGMEDGWFTGRALNTYINSGRKDYVNARRVVNGLDKAGLIAGHARKIEAAIDASI